MARETEIQEPPAQKQKARSPKGKEQIPHVQATPVDTPPVQTSQPSQPRQPALSERDLRWREFRSRNPRFRMFLIVGIVVLLVSGFFLWRYFGSYESIDDAQFDGLLNPVCSRESCHYIYYFII